MATITITIPVLYTFANTEDEMEGEFGESLANVAGIIESAIDNAFGTEHALEINGSVDVTIDEED